MNPVGLDPIRSPVFIISLASIYHRFVSGSAPLPYSPYYSELRYPDMSPSYLIAGQAPVFEKADQIRLQCQLLNIPCVNLQPGPMQLGFPAFPFSSLTQLQQPFKTNPMANVAPWNTLYNNIDPNRLLEPPFISLPSLTWPATMTSESSMLPPVKMPSEEELRRIRDNLGETLRHIQSGVNIINSIMNTAKSIIPR
eukprot:Gregarina_sp_Poly_1__10598@NODE_78_length_15809_cov_160_365646_g66_i0_p6_GENE_NODE_78_length_15809_cov_160_365646_g66_i0NODE_78_length_15809_cov_160_365646_g66_i0_p6_ORF_typecomplete_len196_score12_39_NODE_78_length_15809_cov_160_365646_g66_i091329719